MQLRSILTTCRKVIFFEHRIGYRNFTLFYTFFILFSLQKANNVPSVFRMTLQHGPGNPIVVEELLDDDVEIVEDSEPGREVLIEEMTPEVIQEVRELTPGEFAGHLVPIEENEAEEVWEDERLFREDRLTEDINPVPAYPEPPEYILPPAFDE